MGWAGYAMAGISLARGALGAVDSRKQGKANAKSIAMESAGRAADYRTHGAAIAANARVQAANYDAMADYYLRQAGNFQMHGREERTMRGLELGQDKGRITAEAAGSGIDVTSRVVRKTLADTVKSAYHDFETSAWNEHQNAYGAMKQRAAAKTNAANQRAIAAWAERAYDNLARQTERYGGTMARQAIGAGNAGAVSSLFGGLFGAAGTLAMMSGGGSTTKASGDVGYTVSETGMGLDAADISTTNAFGVGDLMKQNGLGGMGPAGSEFTGLRSSVWR